MKVADLMTHGVVTAAPDTPLHQIAETMEKKAIKRVPILTNGQLVGIVSRAYLVQAIAAKAHDDGSRHWSLHLGRGGSSSVDAMISTTRPALGDT